MNATTNGSAKDNNNVLFLNLYKDLNLTIKNCNCIFLLQGQKRINYVPSP